MFIILNRIGDSITGSINGESFGISFSEEKYSQLKDLKVQSEAVETIDELNAILEQAKALTQETYKEVVETSTPYIFVNKATGKFYLQVGSGADVKVSSQPLPQAFVDRIIKSVEKGEDVLPLVKAWARFLRNPKYTAAKAQRFANYLNKTYYDANLAAKLIHECGVSTEVAAERATGFQTPITQEGLICTYKVSDEITEKWVLDENGERKQVSRFTKSIDEITGEITEHKPEVVEDRIFQPAVQGTHGDAFYCGDTLGHIIRVGQRHRLESWDQVNCDDSRSCVKGLHCGNLDYIRGYENDNTETHQVFVDPMNIGAITDDGSGAIRVLEYFVYASFAGPNRSIYHSSKYAALTDAAYEQMFAEAVAAHEQKLADSDNAISQQAALRSI
jgi:hypothetical protein